MPPWHMIKSNKLTFIVYVMFLSVEYHFIFLKLYWSYPMVNLISDILEISIFKRPKNKVSSKIAYLYNFLKNRFHVYHFRN